MLFVIFRASIKNTTQKYSKIRELKLHTLENISLTTSATTIKNYQYWRRGLNLKKCDIWKVNHK